MLTGWVNVVYNDSQPRNNGFNTMSKLQTQTVLDHLETGQTLTATQARCNFDIHRLAARISTLRKSGHTIDSIPIGGGFVKYEFSAPYELDFFQFLSARGILDEYIVANTAFHSHEGFKLKGDPKYYLASLLIWPDVDKWTIHSRDWVLRLESIQTTQSYV